jgi:hypothetical protein
VKPRSWKRLVYVTRTGKTYHHKPHHDLYMVTWTQRFAHEGLQYEPCQACFRGTKPRHRGRLVEAQQQLSWAPSKPEPIGVV